jgi:chloramphenicol O-acetyltransferase
MKYYSMVDLLILIWYCRSSYFCICTYLRLQSIDFRLYLDDNYISVYRGVNHLQLLFVTPSLIYEISRIVNNMSCFTHRIAITTHTLVAWSIVDLALLVAR